MYIIGYSIIMIEFKNNPDKYLGWAEIATTGGLLCGPTIGSIIYGFVGYRYTFVYFGSVVTLSTILVFFMIPRRLNLSGLDKKDSKT
jgi:MFS family permease